MKTALFTAALVSMPMFAAVPSGMVMIPSKDQTFLRGIDTITLTYNFFVDTTEVTQKSYSMLMKQAYPDYTEPAWNGTVGLGDSFPAYNLSWCDAVLYCNARSIAEGKDPVYTFTIISGTPGNSTQLDGYSEDHSKNGYRLPTDAEWLYAAQGGFGSTFGWRKMSEYFPENAADSAEVNEYVVHSTSSSSPVASKKPNGFGLYDMQGNMFEWTNEWFYNLKGEKLTDPTGPKFGLYHVLRGGSWDKPLYFSVIGQRVAADHSDRFNFVGFRTVCKEFTETELHYSNRAKNSSMRIAGRSIQFETSGTRTIELFNQRGQRLIAAEISGSSYHIPEGFAEGVYSVRVSGNGERSSFLVYCKE